jgi:hypothetical protein
VKVSMKRIITPERIVSTHSHVSSEEIFFIHSFVSGNFDPSLLDMEPLFDPLDEITMSNSLTDDYTNQSTLSYLISSQSRRVSTGKILRKKIIIFSK